MGQMHFQRSHGRIWAPVGDGPLSSVKGGQLHYPRTRPWAKRELLIEHVTISCLEPVPGQFQCPCRWCYSSQARVGSRMGYYNDWLLWKHTTGRNCSFLKKGGYKGDGCVGRNRSWAHKIVRGWSLQPRFSFPPWKGLVVSSSYV